MKLITGLFLLVLTLVALFAAAFLIPEVPHSRGVTHPDYPTMSRGGAGAERHDGALLWIGWAIGAVEIVFFVGLMALGARRGDDLRGLGKPLLIGGAFHLAIWTWLVVAYRSYMYDPDPALYLTLPLPSAIMLYLVWPVPVIFAVFFVFGFRRWVLSEEDQAEFQRLVARRRAAEKREEAA